MALCLTQLLLLLPLLAATSLEIPSKDIAPGVSMPVVSIGTGGTESANASVIVQNWLELGGRGIDTAQIYRDQAVVAKAIAESGVGRKELFITTKIMGCALTKFDVEYDLSQLRMDYVDLMLIHFPTGGNCSAAWSIMEDYHARGVLKAIGVSNFKKADLQALLKTAKVVPAVNQIQLNVLSHDDDTIAFTHANGITIEAYSPLGRDSGKIPQNKVIQDVAAHHNVSAYQVASKWILQHGYVLTFQSTSKEHQEMDADLFGFTLTDDELASLDSLQGQSGNPSLIV